MSMNLTPSSATASPHAGALWLTSLRVPASWCDRDSQAVHRTLAHALDGAPGRTLWVRPRRELLIVQASRPLSDGDVLGAHVLVSRQVSPRRDLGAPMEVSLVGNPTTRVQTPHGVRGARRPLPRESWEWWLRHKLDGALSVGAVETQGLGTSTGRRHGHRVAHLLVAFTAWGTVTDPDALEALIRSGVGSGKAYGAGLLLVGEVTR